MEAEQPFRTDLEYYEGRADGIATRRRRRPSTRRGASSRAATGSSELGRARRATSRRCATAASRRRRSCSPTGRSRRATRRRSTSCSTRIRSSSGSAARTATTCSAWPAARRSCGCCSSAAPTRTAATTTAGRSCTRPATRNDRALARADARRRRPSRRLRARATAARRSSSALFWGHREVVDLLGLEPRNLRVAAGLGARRPDPTSSPGRRRPARTARFYRPHGGFPAWRAVATIRRRCSTRRSSGRRRATGSRRSSQLVELGARVDADPYRGTALTWAAVNGRVDAVRRARRARRRPERCAARFGGPDHGEGVTALHLAAQAGRREAVEALLASGRRPLDRRCAPRRHAGRLGGVRRPSRACGAAAEPRLTGERVFV